MNIYIKVNSEQEEREILQHVKENLEIKNIRLKNDSEIKFIEIDFYIDEYICYCWDVRSYGTFTQEETEVPISEFINSSMEQLKEKYG